MAIVDRARYFRDLLKFFAKQRLSGFDIPDEPHFDEVSKPVFSSLIRGCRGYMEYGSGGSTVMAARLEKPFICVDTDKYFLASVRRKIGRLLPTQHLVHADVGLTGFWGTPVLGKHPSRRRLDKWKAYAQTPWRLVDAADPPDLVLVDGRFRVSAALTSLDHLQANPEARILVDDYDGRPHYHVIEEHARLVRMCGRMAVFQPAVSDRQALRRAMETYATDWR